MPFRFHKGFELAEFHRLYKKTESSVVCGVRHFNICVSPGKFCFHLVKSFREAVDI